MPRLEVSWFPRIVKALNLQPSPLSPPSPSTPRPAPVAQTRHRVLRDYAIPSGLYDEVLDSTGQPREHYRGLLDEMDELGTEELKRRWQTGKRFIHEQGVTYNVYGDPLGMERPWELDPVPMMISAAEWAKLEVALQQRARLINAIIADCYGEQTLIKGGWLPPALVLAQPDFLRACHGIKPAGDVYLNCYAVDLARSPDGKWWAISDRTPDPHWRRLHPGQPPRDLTRVARGLPRQQRAPLGWILRPDAPTPSRASPCGGRMTRAS